MNEQKQSKSEEISKFIVFDDVINGNKTLYAKKNEQSIPPQQPNTNNIY